MMMRTSRNDPFCFYSCTISSFLENTVPTFVENLEPFYRSDGDTLTWLRSVWLPEEAEHARLLKNYVQTVWPEFQWERAYALFCDHYVPQCASEKLRSSPGLEALSRCVIETETAMVYRCIASYAADPELRALMTRISADEVSHYRRFSKIHEQQQAREKTSFLRRARTIIARSELIREEDLSLAFDPINAVWEAPPPFELWSYTQFLTCAANIMREHFPFEDARRMLFHPLKSKAPASRIAVGVMSWIVSRQYMRYA